MFLVALFYSEIHFRPKQTDKQMMMNNWVNPRKLWDYIYHRRCENKCMEIPSYIRVDYL